MSHGFTPEPPAGSEQYREGWRDGYTQKGRDMAALAEAVNIPAAEWSGAWAALTGYVQAAESDGGQIDPSLMLQYMSELKRGALAPVKEWVQSIMNPGG